MPVGVQCPIYSSLGELPSYWDWLWCPGLSPVLVSIAFPSLSILGVFHSLFSTIGFQSCFFFTADVSPPIRLTLHLLTFSVSFQAWDWLWYPMLWAQRRAGRGVHGAENSLQISALAGVNPRTLAA